MPQPDLDADWWTIRDVADYLGVAPGTVTSYLGRAQMPPPEQRYARTPLWRPDTIVRWHAQRPGRGRWGTRTPPPS